MECHKCRKVLAKKGSHFVCQGACQGTYHRACVKGLAADMKAGKTRLCCNNCEEDYPVSDTEHDDEGTPSVTEMIKKVLKKVSVLPGLQKQLNSITEGLSLLSDKYDTLLAEHEQSKDKIGKLEKMAATTVNKFTYIEKHNLALEQKLQEIEHLTRRHNIEIVGIECVPSEDVMKIVNMLGSKINVGCQDIETAQRAYVHKPGDRPAPIIVSFKTTGTASRDKWLAQRRSLIGVTSDAITGGTITNRIYINEDLTKTTRTLLWNAKTQLHGVFKYIWVANGKILIKKGDGCNSIWVRSENDLRDLLNNK